MWKMEQAWTSAGNSQGTFPTWPADFPLPFPFFVPALGFSTWVQSELQSQGSSRYGKLLSTSSFFHYFSPHTTSSHLANFQPPNVAAQMQFQPEMHLQTSPCLALHPIRQSPQHTISIHITPWRLDPPSPTTCIPSQGPQTYFTNCIHDHSCLLHPVTGTEWTHSMHPSHTLLGLTGLILCFRLSSSLDGCWDACGHARG